jgi:hypothetical protein
MRRTFKLLPYMLGMALITMIVSCGKEGPAGPAGAAGPAGPAGGSGPAGPAGTANVIYSDWLDVTFVVQKDPNTGDTLSWLATINATKLDANILAKGEIKVYVNLNTAATPRVVPLPIDPFVWNAIISPYYELGKITLVGDDNYSTFTQNNVKALQYRYILIPGGTTARTSSQINWNDYKQVQTYLGLKD